MKPGDLITCNVEQEMHRVVLTRSRGLVGDDNPACGYAVEGNVGMVVAVSDCVTLDHDGHDYGIELLVLFGDQLGWNWEHCFCEA